MRYFFLAYALLTVLVIGVLGVRGQKFSNAPFELFPDMDRHDKVKAQKPDSFFGDGVGSRKPVKGTTASHFANEQRGAENSGFEFSEGRTGYYYTGRLDGKYGTGMPTELGLTSENAAALIRRGEERYGIYCAICHGDSGNGGGMASKLGVPGVANFHEPTFQSDVYPDGQLYEVINKGKGQMGAYGYNIPVRDRWAIVAYVRAMQTAANPSSAGDAELAQSEGLPKE